MPSRGMVLSGCVQIIFAWFIVVVNVKMMDAHSAMVLNPLLNTESERMLGMAYAWNPLTKTAYAWSLTTVQM